MLDAFPLKKNMVAWSENRDN